MRRLRWSQQRADVGLQFAALALPRGFASAQRMGSGVDLAFARGDSGGLLFKDRLLMLRPALPFVPLAQELLAPLIQPLDGFGQGIFPFRQLPTLREKFVCQSGSQFSERACRLDGRRLQRGLLPQLFRGQSQLDGFAVRVSNLLFQMLQRGFTLQQALLPGR